MTGTGNSGSKSLPLGAERRKFPRFRSRLTLTYAVLGTHQQGQAITQDVSGGGIRFIAEHRLNPGAHLDMTMRIAGREEPVKFIGKVVWVRPIEARVSPSADAHVEVGVQFQDIDPKDRVLIIQEGAVYGPGSR